jgi:tRNA (guanine37-N1)-methyltransferase
MLDIRDNPSNKHGQIDSKPYGGGEGMLMMAEPLKKTLDNISQSNRGKSYLFITAREII